MVAFFDNDSKRVMKVGNEDVLLAGWVPPDNECAICLVPPSVTQEQGLALQKIIEANFRKPALVLTSNTQLVRLKPITDAEAERIMKGNRDASVVQISAEAQGPEESASGEASEDQGAGVREADSDGHAGDLRPPEADSGAGGAQGGQVEAERVSDAPEVEPGEAERPGPGGEGS